MKLLDTSIAGVKILEVEPISDERGFFARVFDTDGFADAGLGVEFPQWSVSFNNLRGTLRGLHFQAAPHGEEKLVRCTAGALFDVAVDLRHQSPTFGRWTSVELTADNHRTLYIPGGCAHGFLTLADETEVLYHISRRYVPEAARGICWDDPDVAIDWPAKVEVISGKDAALPRLAEAVGRAGSV